MELIKDFWRCAIIRAPLMEIVERDTLDGLPLLWLPDSDTLGYYADPFGLWRDDRLNVFVERFDFRDGVGRIEVLVLDRTLQLVARRPALAEPWHLSYPYVFEADGETWMLPEARESGTLRLYQAHAFPFEWRPAADIALDAVPLDATPFHHQGRWWLFYAPAEPASARLTTLCAAHAPALTGPWTPFAGNPVIVDPRGARPGGTPISMGNRIVLPVQRSTGSYGSGMRLVHLNLLSPEAIEAAIVREFEPPAAAAPWIAGLHTMAAAGDVTLIDVKQRRFSPVALATWPGRLLSRRATST